MSRDVTTGMPNRVGLRVMDGRAGYLGRDPTVCDVRVVDIAALSRRKCLFCVTKIFFFSCIALHNGLVNALKNRF